MSNRVSLSPRDLAMLRLLGWTPATTSLLQLASVAFDGGSFTDERRLRERLQALQEAAFVRSWSTAHAGGGLQKYFKLTPLGFELIYGTEAEKPARAFFAEVSPSLFEHTFRLAEVIVHTFLACHTKQVTILSFIRENELTFTAGQETVQPDGFFRLATGGRNFHLAIEIDNSTESLESPAANSVRRKLITYHAYQELVLSQWLAGGKSWEKPRFRVVFLTPSVERAYHILALAAEITSNFRRRLVYAAMLADFITETAPLHAPIFLDHHGLWQSLIDLHPTAAYHKTSVRLPRPVQPPLGLW
jgi:hypothetical protein